MNSLLRGLMASDVNSNRPLASLILLGIVDFCCILIGLEQISVGKIIPGAVWISFGVLSGAIGYNWSQIKQTIGSIGAKFRRKPSKLVIHWANYRAVENAGEVFQVDEFLRQLISGDSLVFDIESHNFVIGDKNFVPHDPLPFKEKRIQVNYSYGTEPARTTERREHGRLLLPEDSKIKWLMGEVDRLKAAPKERETKILLPGSYSTPQELRGGVVSLLGGLYALLIDNGDNPCPPEEPWKTGLEDRNPDQPYIKAAFTERFSDQLSAIADGADRNGFWEIISFALAGVRERTLMLDGDVRNGDDVRSRIAILKELLQAIDRKYSRRSLQ
jgi:hypothetical protein